MRKCWIRAIGPIIAAMLIVACSVDGDGDENLPSYKTYAYATSANGIYAFSVNTDTGAPTEVPGSPFTDGEVPSSIALEPSGKFAYVANGSYGGISVFAINAVTGALTAAAGSPFCVGLKILSFAVHPSGGYLYAVGRNVGDSAPWASIFAYTINDATGALNEVAGSPYQAGIYPICIALDPSGKFAYTSEYDDDYIYGFEINGVTGALTPVANLRFYGLGSFLVFHPSGKFVYLMSRTTIRAYIVDISTGALTRSSGLGGFEDCGSTFAIDPSGRFAYVGCDIGVLSLVAKIDADTGALTAVASLPFDQRDWLRCIAINPLGKFAYIIKSQIPSIFVFVIDQITGVLTEEAGSPLAAREPLYWMEFIRIAQ